MPMSTWFSLFEAAFVFLCVLGATLMGVWVIAVIVSAATTRRSKINPARYRVGGSL
jgi:hypothetical protein